MHSKFVGVALCAVWLTVAAHAQPVYDQVGDPPTPHFYYEFERGMDGYQDRLTLTSEQVLIGKVLEWGNLVYFWDKAGVRHTLSRLDVKSLEYNRAPALAEKPQLPDLTVAYVERTPRDQSWHGVVSYNEPNKPWLPVLTCDPNDYPLHPQPGQEVTFTVHIRNAGLAEAKPFAWRVWIDDEELGRGRVDTPLAAGAVQAVSLKWAWQEGQHYLRVELDTDDAVDEIAEWNNTFIDPTRALTFFFAVSRSTYEGFNASRNIIDTFSFEDWAHYHVHMMNWLFERSIWPSAPDGIVERVRIDKIVVVENSRDRQYNDQWEPLRFYDHDPNKITMYNGTWPFGSVDRERAALWACKADWGLPHELGHQLGLVDIYQLNSHAFDCMVRNQDGVYENVMHFFPWPATMMHWHGPHLFSEQCAGYLNQTLGRPRGYFGDYYFQLPKKCFIRVLANDGEPLQGVEVSLYQKNTDPNQPGRIPGDAYGGGRTGRDGRMQLPNQPSPRHSTLWGYTLDDNPFGKIDIVGHNCLLLAKLTHNGREEYHWVRAFDLNVGYLRGHTETFTLDLQTHYARDHAPAAPIVDLRPHRHANRTELTLAWEAPQDGDVIEYRVYRKASHGGISEKPFRLARVVTGDRARDGWLSSPVIPHEQFRREGHYSKDSYFAVTAVDADGRESALSNVIYVPYSHGADKLAVAPDGKVFFTLLSSETQLVRWDGEDRLSDFGLRARHNRRYRPHCGGVTFDPRGNFVIADPHYQQVAVFDPRGDLMMQFGDPNLGRSPDRTKPGVFNYPADVAVAVDGRFFVADRRNHRVQVFDAEGALLHTFGEQGDGAGQFNEPTALTIHEQRLAVTDYRNRRVIVYDIEQSPPAAVLTLDGLDNPDRAVIAPSGRIYVCARDKEHRSAIQIYSAAGELERNIRHVGRTPVDNPRGLCAGPDGQAYFVNAMPYEVLSTPLE